MSRSYRCQRLGVQNFTARWPLVLTLAWSGRDEGAERAAAPALAMSGRHPRILAELAAFHAARGKASAANLIHRELCDRVRSGHIGLAEQAVVAASAGHLDEARRLVGEALAAHDPYSMMSNTLVDRTVLLRPLETPGDDECDIVALLVRAEPMHFVEDCGDDIPGAQIA
jgi:hypothetical protein